MLLLRFNDVPVLSSDLMAAACVRWAAAALWVEKTAMCRSSPPPSPRAAAAAAAAAAAMGGRWSWNCRPGKWAWLASIGTRPPCPFRTGTTRKALPLGDMASRSAAAKGACLCWLVFHGWNGRKEAFEPPPPARRRSEGRPLAEQWPALTCCCGFFLRGPLSSWTAKWKEEKKKRKNNVNSASCHINLYILTTELPTSLSACFVIWYLKESFYYNKIIHMM